MNGSSPKEYPVGQVPNTCQTQSSSNVPLFHQETQCCFPQFFCEPRLVHHMNPVLAQGDSNRFHDPCLRWQS